MAQARGTVRIEGRTRRRDDGARIPAAGNWTSQHGRNRVASCLCHARSPVPSLWATCRNHSSWKARTGSTCRTRRKLSWQKILATVGDGATEARLRWSPQLGLARRRRRLEDPERFNLVLGITCHAIYHAGQIQLIKRLRER